MHPEWEINFQVALTDIYDTQATWVESVPGLKDFSPMEMKYGEYYILMEINALMETKSTKQILQE
jgi:hypothetical protein